MLIPLILAIIYFIIFKIKGIKTALSSVQQNPYFQNLNPQVAKRFEDFIKDVEANTDFAIIITSGYRTFEKQDELYKSGQTQTKAGYSTHNYGAALDINAQSPTKSLRMSSSKTDWSASRIPEIASKYGISWGGNFTTPDRVHFYIPNLDTTALRNKAIQQFGADYKNIKGNEIKLF